MKRLLGDLLVDMGCLAEHQLEEALEEQRQRGGAPRLGELLVERGACDDEQVAKAVALQAGLKYCRISKFQVPASVVATVPKTVAERAFVFPLKVGKRALIVASDAPLEAVVIEDLRFILGREVEVVIASTVEVQQAIDDHYGRPEAPLSRDDLTVVMGSGLFGRALSRLTGEIEVLLREDGLRLSGAHEGVRVQHELRLQPEQQALLLDRLHLDAPVLAAARAGWQHVSLPAADPPVELGVRAFLSPAGWSLTIQRA